MKTIQASIYFFSYTVVINERSLTPCVAYSPIQQSDDWHSSPLSLLVISPIKNFPMRWRNIRSDLVVMINPRNEAKHKGIVFKHTLNKSSEGLANTEQRCNLEKKISCFASNVSSISTAHLMGRCVRLHTRTHAQSQVRAHTYPCAQK